MGAVAFEGLGRLGGFGGFGGFGEIGNNGSFGSFGDFGFWLFDSFGLGLFDSFGLRGWGGLRESGRREVEGFGCDAVVQFYRLKEGKRFVYAGGYVWKRCEEGFASGCEFPEIVDVDSLAAL